MEYNKPFFEKVFSTKRMERYFNLYPDNEARAILHYRCNLELTEAFYTSLSVFGNIAQCFVQGTGDHDRQGGLVCCIPDHSRSDKAELLCYTSEQTDIGKA